MSPIKLLNYLIFLENLLGIYRNFCTQRKIKKYFIIFHLIVLIIFKTYVVFCQVYIFLLLGDFYNQINHIYSYLVLSSFSTCLVSVITGICSSPAFISYVESISHILKRFKDDNTTSYSKLYWFSIFFAIFSITFAILRSFDLITNFDQIDNDLYMVYFIPTFMSQTYIRISILSEGLVLFVVIMLVVNMSTCLCSMISVVQEKVGRCNVIPGEQCDITGEQIQGWVEIYRHLSNCCDKVTLSFGCQFLYLILISLSYYILLSYQMCYLSFINTADKKIALVIMSYVLLTIFPIIAGQLVLNQGIKFHRVLARLYNTMAVIESKKAEAKLIKDFIIKIKRNPLEIKLVSKITAGTYLLPVMLMSTVNYIIVMLQFNNIV